MKGFWRALKNSVDKIVIVLIVIEFIFIPFTKQPLLAIERSEGKSMEPTLGDFNIVFCVNSVIKKPEEGDIIIATVNGHKIEKRIIGVPGDHIYIDTDGTIYINESLYIENYETTGKMNLDNLLVTGSVSHNHPWLDYNEKRELVIDIVLSDDEYWIMGDNRINSLDSRCFGPVKREDIKAYSFILVNLS